jgi:antitoxin component of RelBE/YafQ-DinJ toxin-antitoxin module
MQENATTTIRVRPSTKLALKKLGLKYGYTPDEAIRVMLADTKKRMKGAEVSWRRFEAPR